MFLMSYGFIFIGIGVIFIAKTNTNFNNGVVSKISKPLISFSKLKVSIENNRIMNELEFDYYYTNLYT